MREHIRLKPCTCPRTRPEHGATRKDRGEAAYARLKSSAPIQELFRILQGIIGAPGLPNLILCIRLPEPLEIGKHGVPTVCRFLCYRAQRIVCGWLAGFLCCISCDEIGRNLSAEDRVHMQYVVRRVGDRIRMSLSIRQAGGVHVA
jgi:hypothetical protein